MANELFEHGGNASILIKTTVPVTIGGVNYAANEPYALISNAYVSFGYDEISSDSKAKKTVLATLSGRPDNISITQIDFTKKICDLVATQNISGNSSKTYQERIYCNVDGSIVSTNEILNNSVIFAYDNSDGHKVAVDSFSGTLIQGDFVSGEHYIVFYKISINALQYSFEIPHFPYFALEINSKGNTDKVSSKSHMEFPTVSLVAVPNFNLYNGSIFNVPLNFKVIYEKQEEPTISFSGI